MSKDDIYLIVIMYFFQEYYNLAGSLLFLIASIYTLPFNNSLCFSNKCYYDYSLLYLFGCVLFFASSSFDLYKNVCKNSILNQIGSSLFVLGSTLFLLDSNKQGVIVFRFGSCFYVVSSMFYDVSPLEIRIQFISGSTLFIIGGFLTIDIYKSILWIIGSMFFCIGSFISLRTL